MPMSGANHCLLSVPGQTRPGQDVSFKYTWLEGRKVVSVSTPTNLLTQRTDTVETRGLVG